MPVSLPLYTLRVSVRTAIRTMLSLWLKNLMASVYRGKSLKCCGMKGHAWTIVGRRVISECHCRDANIHKGAGPTHLVEEKVYSVFVEFEGESLEEGNVVGEDLLVREVQLQHNDGVDMVVGEKVV